MPLRPIPLAAAPRPRRRRAWLVFVPFTIGVLFLAACAAAWFVERARLEAALDAAPGRARAAGVELAFGGVRVGGFPFRLRVAAGPVRVAWRSGWRVEAPALVAQAYVLAPLHWVLSAPEGLTVGRPQGGPLRITGSALRASVAGVDRSPWRVALVGDDVAFAAPAGAKPFSLTGAGRIGLYLKPGAAPGEAALLLELDRARGSPGSLAWNLAPDAAFDAAVEGRLTALSALRGARGDAAVRRWRDAGGRLVLGHLEAVGGPTELWAQEGAVAVDADGRLAGAVPFRLRQAPQLFAGPAGAQTVTVGRLDPAARERASSRFDLTLRDGEVRLGPVRVGPSPRIVGAER